MKTSFIDVDYRKLVSRADVIYKSPVEKPVTSGNYDASLLGADFVYRRPAETPAEGHPVGNGRMGTLVWTTPESITMQINRNDVYAVNKNHQGRWRGPTDYFGGCGGINIDVGGEPFKAGRSFKQHLSLYEGLCSVTGDKVNVQCFVSAIHDILVIEVDDKREQPQPIRITLSMWRPSEVKTGEHIARYEFHNTEDKLLLVQEFREKDYFCASAIGVGVTGQPVSISNPVSKASVIISPGRKGKTLILISSSASMSAGEGMGATALQLLEQCSVKSYDELFNEHKNWWSDFWKRTFIHTSGHNDIVNFMVCLRYLHLYIMASTSRGKIAPRLQMLFNTERDNSRWGSQFWLWTTESTYYPLFAADAADLIEPFLKMYLNQLPDCEKAARQRLGANGAFYPETMPFDGPVVLPEDVAVEFQDVILGRKKYTDMSLPARELGIFESYLATFSLEICTRALSAGRFKQISHQFSSGSKVALYAWWYYRYTGNEKWLGSGAYPLLRATAELYRSLFKKEGDGRYHIRESNVKESFWGVKDSIVDLAAVRGVVPLAIHAAKMLNVDTALCVKWEEFINNLAPYPMGSEPESKALTGGVLADDAFAAGHLGEVNGSFHSEDVWLPMVFPYEEYTLETDNPFLERAVRRTFNLLPRMQSVQNGEKLDTAIRTPIVASRLGLSDKLLPILACYYTAFNPLCNGISPFEGAMDYSVEHLGIISTALQDALLQSISPGPGEDEVIRVFPAWPGEIDVSFSLLARGGFLVTSSMKDGEIEFVEIESRFGEECRLHNPWNRTCTVTGEGKESMELNGKTVCFNTEKGKHYVVMAIDKSKPPKRLIAPEPSALPISYSFLSPEGMTFKASLGR